MELKAFAILDTVINRYDSPLFRHNKGDAIRLMMDILSRGDNMFAKHPEDYILFEIGTYDDDLALLKSLDKPVSVGCLKEFVKSAK